MDKTYTKGMLKLRGDVRKLRNRARNKERALNAELIKRRTKNKDMQTRKGGMFPFFLLSSLFTFGHKLPIIGGLIKKNERLVRKNYYLDFTSFIQENFYYNDTPTL